jgi:hypothetical protein
MLTQAHNLKVIGSNPIPATKQTSDFMMVSEGRPWGGFLVFEPCRHRASVRNTVRAVLELAHTGMRYAGVSLAPDTGLQKI